MVATIGNTIIEYGDWALEQGAWLKKPLKALIIGHEWGKYAPQLKDWCVKHLSFLKGADKHLSVPAFFSQAKKTHAFATKVFDGKVAADELARETIIHTGDFLEKGCKVGMWVHDRIVTLKIAPFLGPAAAICALLASSVRLVIASGDLLMAAVEGGDTTEASLKFLQKSLTFMIVLLAAFTLFAGITVNAFSLLVLATASLGLDLIL